MIRICILSWILFLSGAVHAQKDFFILKKKNITEQVFNDDSYINCELKTGQWVEGYIRDIRDDSVSVALFNIRYLPTIWGTQLADTVQEGNLNIQIDDISSFPRKGKSDVPGVPSVLLISKVLQIGGIGYDGLNIINSISYKDPLFASGNTARLLAGASAFLLGKFIQKTWYSPVEVIGKKYQLQYVSMSAASQ